MSLPPGFLDELRTRLSIAQVVGRKVTWDSRKSNAAKSDYWAPCPFHQEKTASFHVDDRKGFYYCFGCHAKGDALSFVRETENVGFMEAVEILAREAGLQMPARDPQAQQRADERTRLADVMEQAVQHYRLQLKTSLAAEARAYLDRRGLSEATQTRFEIGFAPDQRTGLFDHLRDKGVPVEDIVAAGLAIQPDDGGAPYDRFRGRIMFPIRDVRGRATAFGGRAMDPNARAKYLNSNETALFDKGRSLYNHAPAREASGKTAKLIVAEGYMDVIALAAAGFEHAVAPLGTAITEDQLQLIWRICEEPVIALDGDTAGLRAAMRLIDVALPLLEAGKSLRFCLLPEGQDPDDLIRARGAKAMADLLDKAQPMVDLLWRRETDGKVFDSPERRAALDASLRTAIRKINDPSVRNHYAAAIKDMRVTLFRPTNAAQSQNGGRRGPMRGGFRTPAIPLPTPGTKGSLLAQPGAGAETDARVREAVVLAGCLNHPYLLTDLEAELEKLTFLSPDLAELRSCLLSVAADLLDQHLDTDRETLAERIEGRLGYAPLDKLEQIGPVRANRTIRHDAPPEFAKQTVVEEMKKHEAALGIEAEIQDAAEELSGVADEGVTWRLQQASEAKDKVAREALGRDGEDQTDDRALSEHLQSLLDQQIWLRKRK